MATIDDVRRALKEAYDWLATTPSGIEGKSSEAWCSVHYPEYWSKGDFFTPCRLDIYSYALGPSRNHYFCVGPVDRQVNYYTWESPDIFAKAVEVIAQWVDEAKERVAEDAADWESYRLTPKGEAALKGEE